MNEHFGFPDRKPRRNDEELLHRAVWQHIKIMGSPEIIAYHPANGESRSKRTGGRLKAMGVVAGTPDLAFVLPDGRAAFMELKAAGGRLSREQKAFQAKCDKMGVPYAVCWSIDAAVEVLKAWGVLQFR